MTSPTRKQLHMRSITYAGYKRDDGLWDLEAIMIDRKGYESRLHDMRLRPVGEPIHDISIRVAVDESMVIREISATMDSVPFSECLSVLDRLQGIVGVTIGSGWRLSIEQNLGGTKGCTHLRELLLGIATLAYQTIFGYQAHLRREAGIPSSVNEQPPFFIGRCMAWALNGPVVKRYYPQFAVSPSKCKDD